MALWGERSPPTNVSRVRFPDPASYVGWICCWLSTLLREVFLRVLRFSPLLKNQHFQIPIGSWNARTFLHEFLWTPWCSLGKQITDNYLRNRKDVPCFYRVEVWENEKCCENTSHMRVFPQLFRVLPNFHECFYNAIETRRTYFLFLLGNTATKKRKTTC